MPTRPSDTDTDSDSLPISAHEYGSCIPLPQRAEDLDHPYSAHPAIPLGPAPYPENGVYGLGIRHVRPYALFAFEKWASQSLHDYYAIYLQDLIFPAADDLVADLAPNRQVLAILEEHVPEGEISTYGRVSRAGSGTESTSPVQTILIKTTRPGGVDKDPGTAWHTGLAMQVDGFPEGTSIGAGDVAGGIWCLIERYDHLRHNDVIELSWDGVFVLHTVSPTEAAGTAPIRILVDKSIIDQGGQLGKLTLRFRVRDVVENFSGEKYQYSKPYFLEAQLDPSLLSAPIVLVDGNELESRQIDFDTQSEATFEVIASTPRQLPSPSPRHQIVVTLLGILADGTTKSFVLAPVTDNNLGFTFISIDADIIAQLVGGSFRVSFLWQTAGGVPLGQSGSVTITVVGTPVAMPAPQVSPMELGLIPPGEDITVTIPYYEPHSTSWLETLVIEYVPPGGGGAITFRQPQLAGGQGGTRTVTAAELEPFTRRGNINIYYETDDGEAHVLGGSALGVRRSNMLVAQIGDRTADMPEPRLQGAIGNNVDPAAVPGDEVLVTFTYLGTQADDTLYWSCIGSGVNGSASGSFRINAATAGKELPYPVSRRILDNNLNGSLRISYSLERKGPPPLVLRSQVAAFTVGRGVQLDRPIIDGASTFPDELNPLAVLGGAKVIVKYRPMLATDQIHVDWFSVDGIGSDNQQVNGNPATNEVSVSFDPRIIAQGIREGGNTINVQYHFNRGLFPFASEIVALRLLPLTGLPTPTIDGIPGPILDLSRLNPTARTRVPVWHFIHENQRMWMKYEGIKQDDTPFIENTYTANLVTVDGVNNGINPPTPVDKLTLLKDGSTLKISFWVSLAESLDKNTAVLFGVREYIIQALPGVLPHPFIGGASGVGPNVTVEPLTIEHNTTVTVAFGGMRSTDRITFEWIFADCTSHTETKNGLDSGTLVFILTDDKVLHRSVNSTVMLRYSVVRVGVNDPIPSEVQTVRVNAIPTANLPQPLINGIAPGGTLDLSTFAGHATAAVKKWPLSAPEQRVWLTCSSQGVADLSVLTAYPINETEAAQGLANKEVLRSWLASIPNRQQFNIVCHVSFTGSEAERITFPATTYAVQQALTIDTTTMELSTLQAIQSYGWSVIPYPPITRLAAGGSPPYKYSSSNTGVAQVTESDGQVIGISNGTATITATDSLNRQVSYPVRVTNIYRILINNSYMSTIQARQWITSVGGLSSPNTLDVHLSTIRRLVNPTAVLFDNPPGFGSGRFIAHNTLFPDLILFVFVYTSTSPLNPINIAYSDNRTFRAMAIIPT
ncbi:Ig-like domain-containing protein [Pseudomonas sp. LG1E9]|uniref:Ig-like domain-containing protein n=1 Tax=Pseudomonas sp. LG1E9 TaxID=2219057 RepID=UPI000DD4A706|nr:Ig-like domain-containing protein [Pseudomonas sp. LG1E9]